MIWRIFRFSIAGYICFITSPFFANRFSEKQLLCIWNIIYNPNINIPAEALPACENDQYYYVLTARTQFLHSKPIKKKGPSTLGMTTLPSLHPQKGQPQLFLTLKITERSIKFMWKCHEDHRAWHQVHVEMPMTLLSHPNQPHPTPGYRMRMCGIAIEDHGA